MDRRLDVVVASEAKQPLRGVHVEISVAGEKVLSAETDDGGRAAFPAVRGTRCSLTAQLDGYLPATAREIDLTASASTTVELTLTPATARRDSVEVTESVTSVDGGSAAPATVSSTIAKQLPDRPATVADALPMIPGVVREPGGALVISASPEHRTALIVNSTDVTDPATGQFGLTVPIDSVEALNVYQTPYLAEFGRFTAGVVSVETRRGGDKWKWELNDPLPEFRIRSHQLRGLKDATPRLNFEGPVIPGKLYISEGAEYEIRKTAVFTLPFPDNQKRREGLNSFTQFDWIPQPTHLLTATLHVAPQRFRYVNIDYFNPMPTAPDAGTHNYTGTMSDRLTLLGGVLESNLSVTRFDAAVWAQGPADFTITPMGNRGNYFSDQRREAWRRTLGGAFSAKPVTGWGTHNIKLGVSVSSSSENGRVDDSPINILNASGVRLQRIVFTPNRAFDISDREVSIFAQDHWVITPRLAADYGVRTESQQIAGTQRLAPRGGVAWHPFTSTGTVLRVGIGLFYDRVPLNVYCFNRYPNRLITTYDDSGNIVSGPTPYQNTLGQVRVKSPFIHQKPIDGNFSPRSAIWSGHVEQPLTRFLKLRAGYIRNDSNGLVTLNQVEPEGTSPGAYLLSGTGRLHYTQLEFTARVNVGKSREMMVSYVRSQARGDTNEFGSFLGTFPTPIVRGNRYGRLSTDLPNRLLSWGSIPLPHKFAITPVVELRSGFPYSELDAAQRYAGEPNQGRFPTFFSADSRFSKDIQVSQQYAVRLALSTFNLTNHFNPEAVHPNIADPAYGRFFGHRGRRFTVDFDFLF